MKNEIKCPKCGEIFQVDEEGYAAIVKQVRDSEFTKEVSERVENEVELAEQKVKSKFDKELFEKQEQITNLENKLENAKAEKENAIVLTKAEKDNEISKLKNELDKANSEKELAVKNAEDKLKKELSDKNGEIKDLEHKLDNADKEKELALKNIESKYKDELSEKKEELSNMETRYEVQLQMQKEEIERLKDFKQKLSTKMVGESLEQHCEIEFNKFRALGFQNSYFAKDNDAKTGSKGDYIFREEDIDGTPIVSIMFEMKNESDTTGKKHKNEDFLKELDKDRREKGCDYAVLVSMLESDNDFYNQGIVDMSHKYPKMFVIRPQFFVPMIALIRNMALGSLEYIREISYLRAQNVEVRKFYDNLGIFKDSFTTTAKNFHDRFEEAIKGIDSAIKNLEKVKDSLLTSKKHLSAAENKVEKLSIDDLTKNSPNLKEQFKSLLITDKSKKK